MLKAQIFVSPTRHKSDVQQTSRNVGEGTHWSTPLTVLVVEGVGQDVQAAVLVGHSVRSRDGVHEGHLDGLVVHLLCGRTPEAAFNFHRSDFLPRTDWMRGSAATERHGHVRTEASQNGLTSVNRLFLSLLRDIGSSVHDGGTSAATMQRVGSKRLGNHASICPLVSLLS